MARSLSNITKAKEEDLLMSSKCKLRVLYSLAAVPFEMVYHN